MDGYTVECGNAVLSTPRPLTTRLVRTAMAAKKCSKCGEQKPLSSFNLERGKPRAYCKVCHGAAALAWSRSNRERRRAIANAYTKRRREKLGPPKKGGGVRIYTPEEAARRDREAKRDWERRNAHVVLAKTRKYQSRKLRAYPAWANKSAIEAIYLRARELTKRLGVAMEVDHIVPLQGAIVCGLHVENNLQIIPMRKNRSKNNRHWPDKP